MSGRGDNGAQANVNPTGKNYKASSSMGTKSVAVAGGGAIDFEHKCAPQPSPGYFEKAKAVRNSDRRVRKTPR